MKISSNENLNLSDTLVPDLFIINKMNKLGENELKVYLYFLYLKKKNEDFTEKDICFNLDISKEILALTIDNLCEEKLMIKNIDGYTLIDLKEAKINEDFEPSASEMVSSEESEEEKNRMVAAEAINDSFFNGMMPYAWYTDIGELFNKFEFESDVMIALFQYCFERKALNKKYVYAVAETWSKGNIKNFDELEKYFDELSKLQKIVNKICKALGLNRELTKYEKEYVNKWVNEYNYDFKMIEHALKKTVNKTNPSINYVNGILKNWYEKGYVKPEDTEKEEIRPTLNTKVKDKNDSIKFKSFSSADFENLESFYDIM